MSKWVTLQNHVVGQGSCSWTRCAAVHRISVRFASRKALRVSDEEVLGLLQEFQTVLEPTNADNATDDNVSKQWGEQGGMSFEDMPLSPLMHPNLINARKRYTDSKPLPSKDKTEFQKLLVKNPFARLLASPVRQCALTGIRFPKLLLNSFTLRTHPGTGAPWYDPIDLEPKEEPHMSQADEECEKEVSVDQESRSESGQQQVEQPSSALGHISLQNDKISSINESPQLMQDEALPKRTVEQLFPTVEAALRYMPDRSVMQQYAIIHKHKMASNPTEAHTPYTQSSYQPFSQGSYMISDMAAYYRLSKTNRRLLQHIIPRRWKDASASHPTFNLTKDVVWREDMDMFAFDLMRRRMVHILNAAATLRNAYVVPCNSYKTIGDHHQVAAVLWFGSSQGTSPMNKMKEKESRGVEIELERSRARQNVAVKGGADKSKSSESISEEGDARPAGPIDDLSIPPPPYATFLYGGRHVPLFNLHSLLGRKYIDTLRFTETTANAPLYVIKNKRYTLQAVIWLWKLMTYLGHGSERGPVAPKPIVNPKIGYRMEDEKRNDIKAFHLSETSESQIVSSPNLMFNGAHIASFPASGAKQMGIQEVSLPNQAIRKVHTLSFPSPRAKGIENSQTTSFAEKGI